MDGKKEELMKFVMELIDDLEDCTESNIWEYSGNIQKDIEEMKKQMNQKRKKASRLLKKFL